ncbi:MULTISPECIES: DUF3180 domain-containing protein [unclassified Curtobacterium]|uniref:DUF3180 domain-containing protein n=1 Tax=unclassified Curtobacterium TaxID=257496 RepID=UPI000DA77130|nr:MULTISPECIES: DUF3180 domain-containing protein [unclassified Curtobacterium]PZE26088.1 DUF3180 domain-containing protein [Curtobacterium sp. MCBD17_028]PZE77707.1 DUF3180 domain-containing protein [Curtobacterium sp. MCBD17_019]PZF62082.1 DUF3180 domain-containing protein [Curtobacterium sp. MCBD17_034]PZF63011.1 DUF3180 domain-containing protein [Curtobacterium sp. MCBD17_013]PZM33985.1 DUF3180 domain-containing protein [Curtobacterium sp. MCBD17_031]
MRHTRASTLISVAIVAGVAGFALDAALASRQRPVIVLSSALGLTLGFIGIALVLMAIPVRRHARGTATRPVDAFYATRVVVLAKASSICGVLFGAFTGGGLAFVLTRAVVPALGSILPSVVAVFGGLVLMVCALVAEHMCTVPPRDDDDSDPGGTTAI